MPMKDISDRHASFLMAVGIAEYNVRRLKYALPWLAVFVVGFVLGRLL